MAGGSRHVTVDWQVGSGGAGPSSLMARAGPIRLPQVAGAWDGPTWVCYVCRDRGTNT